MTDRSLWRGRAFGPPRGEGFIVDLVVGYVMGSVISDLSGSAAAGSAKNFFWGTFECSNKNVKKTSRISN